MPSPKNLSGYTLIELIIAMASASALMVGLSGSLLISSYALDIDEGSTLVRASADTAMARLTADTRHALEYTERSATAIEFTVPDRDGDDEPETLRYAWGGAEGNPLTRTRKGGSSVVVLKDVHDFSLTYTERLVAAVDVTVEPDPKWPVVESFSSLSLSTSAASIDLPFPLGGTEGELLVAGVVVDGNETSSMVAPVGWALLDVSNENSDVTLSVMWKVVTASEPADYRWQWTGNAWALGWIVRISNQWSGTPITTFTLGNGDLEDPPCPSATSVLDHSLVLRFGGFENDDITVGDPGLAGHTSLLMEASGASVSGGCGYKILRAAGNSGEVSFDLTTNKKRKYRTVTLIIAPAQE